MKLILQRVSGASALVDGEVSLVLIKVFSFCLVWKKVMVKSRSHFL